MLRLYATVRLRDDGLKNREIAAALGITVRAVEMRLQRAWEIKERESQRACAR